MSKHFGHIARSVAALCICLLFFTACGVSPSPASALPPSATARPQAPRMLSLRYHYWDGWAPDYIYIVQQHGDVGLVAQSGWDDRTGSPEWQRLFSQARHAEFIRLLDSYDIWSWNGFDESEEVMDAGAIHITIAFESGETLVVNGFARFPENFAPANQAVLAFFEQIATGTDYVPASALPTGAIP